MRRPHRSRALLYALYANAALLLAILIALLARGGSSAWAVAPQPIAGNGNLYLMPAQLHSNVWGCFVMDLDTQTLLAYAFHGEDKLKLVAARSFRYDRQLQNFNTDPDPEVIRKLVDIEKGRIRGVVPATQPAENPAATTKTGTD